MGMPIKIIIADDHTIFRAGLAALLKRIPRISNIRQAANGREVIKMLESEPADVILMDISMPVLDGIETTLFLSQHYEEVKVIGLSMHDDQDKILSMNSAGAMGYLLKNTDINELKMAIYAVMRGEKYFSKEVSDILLDKLLKGVYRRRMPKEIEPLNERDKEIIRMISGGLSVATIAKILGVADKTVEGYKSKIFHKTGVNNSASLIMYAIKHNIVQS